MAEKNEKNNPSPLSHAASAAGLAKGAVKTGKAVAGAAKGAAAGPYGMAAAGLWENRKLVGKIIAALAALLMLPVLFLLMLPSLIFGTDRFLLTTEYVIVLLVLFFLPFHVPNKYYDPSAQQHHRLLFLPISSVLPPSFLHPIPWNDYVILLFDTS